MILLVKHIILTIITVVTTLIIITKIIKTNNNNNNQQQLEIFRSMLYKGSDTVRDIEFVIFDEVVIVVFVKLSLLY